MSVRIEMTAWPENENDVDGVIAWYVNNGYLADFLEAFATDAIGEMTFRPETGRYEILFIPNEHWPAEVTDQATKAASYLLPDDPRRPVSATILSIRVNEEYMDPPVR